MHNIYRGGTPDVYYEGDKSILWVEYKVERNKKIKVSELQNNWLKRAKDNNIPVAIIVKINKKEAAIIEANDIDSKSYTKRLPINEVASYIKNIVRL